MKQPSNSLAQHIDDVHTCAEHTSNIFKQGYNMNLVNRSQDVTSSIPRQQSSENINSHKHIQMKIPLQVPASPPSMESVGHQNHPDPGNAGQGALLGFTPPRFRGLVQMPGWGPWDPRGAEGLDGLTYPDEVMLDPATMQFCPIYFHHVPPSKPGIKTPASPKAHTTPAALPSAALLPCHCHPRCFKCFASSLTSSDVKSFRNSSRTASTWRFRTTGCLKSGLDVAQAGGLGAWAGLNLIYWVAPTSTHVSNRSKNMCNLLQ